MNGKFKINRKYSTFSSIITLKFIIFIYTIGTYLIRIIQSLLKNYFLTMTVYLNGGAK